MFGQIGAILANIGRRYANTGRLVLAKVGPCWYILTNMWLALVNIGHILAYICQ